ncbi:SubName: Full=Related to family 61 glucanase {ECO:0000313/EMBL:CCA68244.1} [Serendipita indica DSM 11827]|uniref:AA9 family lytic polysaccharide monooxygenase n=1 Tax=Serendipita indica (strain DSM 11827) TaxID=1109443 RepID=G4TA92_SERID|nr:SubName: Full=Related to family 61 glucanase {ECO:0000313/EMBL:CCA68244.1} [Serendipita indica DSM 11827]CCA68244.1 related to family 61 glucanase [Serendipita indica DSM 11827]
MKLLTVILSAGLFSAVNGHYTFTNINGNRNVVRQPANNSPVTDVTSTQVRCNSNAQASDVLTVAAGSSLTFGLDNTFYHLGPAAVYMAKAPSSVTSWDGSGTVWFKVAEWGATFNPFSFKDYNLSGLQFTVPRSISAGQYLVRAEQIGLHVAGAPQFYVSCGQINVTGGGSANPSKVAIPGYISKSDPSITLNIYNPVPTAYRVPGPSVFSG